METSFIVFNVIAFVVVIVAAFRIGAVVNKAQKKEADVAKNSASYEDCIGKNTVKFNYDSFTDSRDGETYRTVKIGNQVWMVDNLRFKTEESYAPGNDEMNIAKYGRLYTWTAALGIPADFSEQSPAKDMEMDIVYDVAHNIVKMETHNVRNREEDLLVHRKGATRAFGPGREEIPEKYRAVGQPVLIPGTMGTASYVLHGTDVAMEETFGSTAHGAGRVLSRSRAKKDYDADKITKDLESKGIRIKATSKHVIEEEAPGAYKDVDSVVRVSDSTGIAKLVAKVKPLAVTKG